MKGFSQYVGKGLIKIPYGIPTIFVTIVLPLMKPKQSIASISIQVKSSPKSGCGSNFCKLKLLLRSGARDGKIKSKTSERNKEGTYGACSLDGSLATLERKRV